MAPSMTVPQPLQQQAPMTIPSGSTPQISSQPAQQQAMSLRGGGCVICCCEIDNFCC
ncbi:hypothetical protein T439DRAFT_360867 [Meredithblackwellia eburnea MCA 4105]